MKKTQRIVLAAIIGIGLAITATQITHNGGLQSAVISAGIYECRTGQITSIERCRDPLTIEKNRIQKEIDPLTRQSATKKSECVKLEKLKKTAQAKICTQQLISIDKNITTRKQTVSALTLSLSKLVSEIPLQTERAKLQKEIETLKTQITVKTTECRTLTSQKKSAQTTTCNTQLTTLKQSQSTKEKFLMTNTEALKKLAGIAALTNSPIPAPVSVKIGAKITPVTTTSNPTPAPTPAPAPTVSRPNESIPVNPAVTILPAPTLAPTASSSTPTPSLTLNSAPTPPTPTTPVPQTPIIAVNTTTPAVSVTPAPTVTIVTPSTSTNTSVSVVNVPAPPAASPIASPTPAVVVIPRGTTASPAPSTNTAQPTTTSSKSSIPPPVKINDPYPTPSMPDLCSDTTAMNYGSVGDCVGGTRPIYGCTDPMALNQRNNATVSDGSCRYPQYGCKIPGSHNYDENNDTVGDPNLCLTCFDGIQNGDEEKMDCGGSKCQTCMMGCMDPNASNYNSAAVIDNGTCIYGMREDYTRPREVYCKDDKADNNYTGEVREPDTVNNEVCIYCDLPKKIEEIRNKEGAKVKTSLNQLDKEEKDKCMKKICESGSVEDTKDSCTIATEFKPHFALLQMYLVLAGEDPGTLDGIYRSSKEITLTPTAASNTRKALVQYASSRTELKEIKDKCPFMKNLLQNELIKDYEPENTERIKVTQMALSMDDKYAGMLLIDGDQQSTYDLLQQKYKWRTEKFGVSYIAGPDMKWQVGRATRFGHNDPGDNGRGSPFMGSISTNNSSVLGASLPLTVTVKLLCPNILADINKLLAHNVHFSYPGHILERKDSKGNTIEQKDIIRDGVEFCQKMMALSDPLAYENWGTLYQCIAFANEAGYTNCHDEILAARVSVSSIGKAISLPLVDIGPSRSVWSGQKEATIDLTDAAMKAISGGNLAGTNYETCFQIIPGKVSPLPIGNSNNT